MKLKQIIFGAVLLLPLLSCSRKQHDQAAQAAEFAAITMTPQQAVLHSVYPVTIRGREDIEIRPRVDGFIEAIYVDEGSVVKRGQVMFKINSPQSVQALTTARAAVNSAQVDVERIRPLVEKGILSQNRLEVAELAYKSALAVQKNAEEAITWTSVTSPVDGLVGTISYRQGSLVDKSNMLTTVANISDVFAYFSLNEKDLMQLLEDLEGNTQSEKIKNISAANLILANGEEYSEKGTVETISGIVNITTGSANFRARFPNPQGLLRSGTSGNIVIPKVLNDVFVIPQQSTFSIQDKRLVFKVEGDSVVQTVISVASLPDGQHFAVKGGLNEGDKIVAEGIVRLRHGDKIRIKQN